MSNLYIEIIFLIQKQKYIILMRMFNILKTVLPLIKQTGSFMN